MSVGGKKLVLAIAGSMAALVVGTIYIAKQYSAAVTSKLTADVSDLNATVQQLKEQNTNLSQENLKLESIKSQLKQLVCDQVDKKVNQAFQTAPPPPPPPAAPQSAAPVPATALAAPAAAAAPPAPAKENEGGGRLSTNPAANMNAQQLDPPIYFPFDLPPDKQRQLDDIVARHNIETLTEFQEHFAGRKPDTAELAQFTKERKQRLITNLRPLLDEEQYRQAEAMLIHDKD